MIIRKLKLICYHMLLVICGVSCLTKTNIPDEPVDLVYPFLDTSNSRWFYFSSASRPFGMVNLSPDTEIDGAWNSGYRYEKDSIKFFSHIHAWQLSGVPVMPTTGEFKGHLGAGVYQSKFDHDNETVFPGYHQVYLNDYNINVELTSTTRVGFHKYTFPESGERSVLLDLGTVLGPSITKYGYVNKKSDREIEGYALMDKTIRRPKPTYVYFVIQFDQPFEKMNSWQHGEITPQVENYEGADGGVYMQFDPAGNSQIQMKVGISYVSESQAKLNIETELPHWDFDQIIAESRTVWNEKLSKIEVSGNSEVQTRRFYTDLWKSLQGRRIISDVDGQYCDMTGDVPRTGQIPLDEDGKLKFNHYNSDSFWGSQWTITTLWDLVYPDIAEQFVQSMLLMYQDGGWIPRGPSGGNYTHVMTGASSTPFIVGTYMKGIRGYDIEQVYQGMIKNHMPVGTMAKGGYEHQTFKGGGLTHYINRGYVPYPLDTVNWSFHQDGAGQTLEYAYQDWCLAQMAKSLGKQEDYRMLADRSANWKNLFDSETKWMRPRELDGSWRENFDQYEYRVGFVESNAAQATWYVPQDLEGLATMMGGHDAASEKLEQSFKEASKLGFTGGKSHDDEEERRNRRIPINYGNQPSIQTAFIFNHLKKPWKTQYWSREVTEKVFGGLSPQSGYRGDEDQGLMGALAVLMKIGLFEMRSGAEIEPIVDLGSPIFDQITIHLDKRYYSGEKIQIISENNSAQNRYINQVSWNDMDLSSASIEHHLLTKGGELRLMMSKEPNITFGSKHLQDTASVSAALQDANRTNRR